MKKAILSEVSALKALSKVQEGGWENSGGSAWGAEKKTQNETGMEEKKKKKNSVPDLGEDRSKKPL